MYSIIHMYNVHYTCSKNKITYLPLGILYFCSLCMCIVKSSRGMVYRFYFVAFQLCTCSTQDLHLHVHILKLIAAYRHTLVHVLCMYMYMYMYIVYVYAQGMPHTMFIIIVYIFATLPSLNQSRLLYPGYL